jgi:hypothetical protein
MVTDQRDQFPRLVVVPDEVLRFPDQPKVFRTNDEGPLRMADEGCPNESPRIDDAT